MEIRAATEDDLEAIFDIYNEEIRTGFATFATEPVTPDEARQWLEVHSIPRHPARVVDLPSEDVRVAGWACLSPWSGKCAYVRTGEISVYVAPAYHRRGLGDALLCAVLDAGRAAGVGVAVARIESTRTPSLALHYKHGFQRVGTMHRVGEKFGRILDVDVLELQLDA